MELRCDPYLRLENGNSLSPKEIELLARLAEGRRLADLASEEGIGKKALRRRLTGLERRIGTGLFEGRGDSLTLNSNGMAILRTFELRRNVLEEQMRELWRKPSLTVDAALIERGEILLVRRGKEPHTGKHALPGGFVEYGERVEDAVVREMREETGLEVEIVDLVGVYSEPDRDPRGHFVTILFLVRRISGTLRAGDDAETAGFHSLSSLPETAFDHITLIEDAVRRRDGR